MKKHFLVATSCAVGLYALSAGACTAQDRREAALGALQATSSQRPEAVDIAGLTLEFEFTIFLQPNCPEEVRRKALHKLWTLLPPVVLEDNNAI